ncbi:MAG: hypothetical protein UT63_C0001G0003 [Candidatus Gottesmanbacteria bacterium GW2011_GWC2_39_8]|uniref:Purine nucleoside phosphorylase n=1 Tax=Candidatus Gottesmanbacteria bacterium GW2011_GWC2_39_8 TaxID=1618450 RepID=A0A0G0QAS3_9BACT|nr:MAG: hypothetical protein UT63_C0001G0003 [Candidatus Gottesmanbacteria bacterium GW2011_GWC2_39_8]
MMQSKKLSKFPDLIHYFGTRNDNITLGNAVFAEQVHKDRIAVVRKSDKSKVIQGADGLVTADRNINLVIKTADCVPILFFDKKTGIIGACHAGWKGTFAGIAGNTVKQLLMLGGKVEDITAAIGPHVGACCYTIEEERATQFIEKFGLNNTYIGKTDNKYYLDLGRLNFEILLSSGIKKGNIDFILGCTCCQESLYYSFRRDKERAGRMISVIGII